MGSARKAAEEALRAYAACPPEANLSCVTCTPRLVSALRALLAEPAPAPSEAVREAAEALREDLKYVNLRYVEADAGSAVADAIRSAEKLLAALAAKEEDRG